MSRPNWQEIAPQLRTARMNAGLSVLELSMRTGIHTAHIYAYERGTTEPLSATFLALCIVLDVDPRGLVAAA
jgi:transcriptional regulator with XRE-family HTH domain